MANLRCEGCALALNIGKYENFLDVNGNVSNNIGPNGKLRTCLKPDDINVEQKEITGSEAECIYPERYVPAEVIVLLNQT